MSRSTGASPKRLAVFDQLAVIANRELGDQFVDLKVTTAVFDEVLTATRETLGMNSQGLSRARVAEWLSSEPPHIDHVAVSRALGYDWDVIANLTSFERAEFIAKLAQTDDPFDDTDEVCDGQGKVVSAGPRRLRWRAGPPEERELIRNAVTASRIRAA